MNSEVAAYLPATSGDGGAARTKARQSPSSVPEGLHSAYNLTASRDRSSSADRLSGAAGFSDETLLEGVHRGDKEALAILFRRYARLVRAVAYRILRNADEADDLVQEVFLFIFRKPALYDRELSSARSWIVQMTYQRAIDRRRYLSSRHFYSNVEVSAAGAAELRTATAFYEQSIEGVLGKETLRRIDQALSEDQRRTIQLFFFEGYTLEEIAGLTGQPVANIKNHYYRALEKMRKQISRAKLWAKQAIW